MFTNLVFLELIDAEIKLFSHTVQHLRKPLKYRNDLVNAVKPFCCSSLKKYMINFDFEVAN